MLLTGCSTATEAPRLEEPQADPGWSNHPGPSGPRLHPDDLPVLSTSTRCQPSSSPGADSDFDGLNDLEETGLGTDPCDIDSDADGFIDLAEVRFGGDPADPEVGLTDYVEIPRISEMTETEVSFQLRLVRADVHLLVDASGSMAGFIRRLAQGFSTMVGQLDAAVPDATWGLSSFRNYVFGTLGANYPFRLHQQATSDHGQIQRGLDELVAQGGGLHESSLEGLYQVLTGAGYDEACNGVYDPVGDVRPFQAFPGDPFGGQAGSAQHNDVPGSGKLGGVGFRTGAYKLVIYGTDEELLDPDRGDPTPGGCPQDSGLSAVVAAARSVGAKIIGVGVGHGAPPSGVQVRQMQELATLTGSTYTDDMGEEQSLYFSWYSGDLVRNLMALVTRVLGGLSFESVRVEVETDQGGLVHAITPERIGPISVDEFVSPKSFIVSLRPANIRSTRWILSPVEMKLFSDNDVELAHKTLVVAIPPRP